MTVDWTINLKFTEIPLQQSLNFFISPQPWPPSPPISIYLFIIYLQLFFSLTTLSSCFKKKIVNRFARVMNALIFN